MESGTTTLPPPPYPEGGQIHLNTQEIVKQLETSKRKAAAQTSRNIKDANVMEVNLNDVDEDEDVQKKLLYRHPLFPLMALLFEKCEQATQTNDCPSSESFDIDIQQFVQHQEKENKPIFLDIPDLDELMVKAIQVLRIHLLELEKVNDLCKDFCQRYISCLKGKLQNEQLLRIDGLEGNECNLSFSDPVMQQISPTATTTCSPQKTPEHVMSGNTVYQMVQTPQGLVAQPIQIALNTTSCDSTDVVKGSTPLSKIGAMEKISPSSSATEFAVVSRTDFEEDKKLSKRGILPKSATQIMKSWLFQHIVHPYPTEEEKKTISSQTGLSILQINNWFINARRRILQPMLDHTNLDLPKQKRPKAPQSRPQKYWPESLSQISHPDRIEMDHEESSNSSEIEGTDHSVPHILEENLNTVDEASNTEVAAVINNVQEVTQKMFLQQAESSKDTNMNQIPENSETS